MLYLLLGRFNVLTLSVASIQVLVVLLVHLVLLELRHLLTELVRAKVLHLLILSRSLLGLTLADVCLSLWSYRLLLLGLVIVLIALKQCLRL